MNAYEQLLSRYGVSTQQTPYAGQSEPDPAAANYAELKAKYDAEHGAYSDWLNEYKQRIKAFNLYGPGSQGPALGAAPTVGAPLAARVAEVAASPAASSLDGAFAPAYAAQRSMGNTPTAASNLSDAQWSAVKRMRDEQGWNNPYDTAGLKSLGAIGVGALGGPLGILGAAYKAMGPEGGQLQAINDYMSRSATTTPVYSPTAPTPTNLDSMNDTTPANEERGRYGNYNDTTPTSQSPEHADGATSIHFADGGLAELNSRYAPPGMQGAADTPGNFGLDMSKVSPEQERMMQEQDPGAMLRGQERFSAAQDANATPRAGAYQQMNLPAMLAKYQPTESQYAGEYQAARERAASEQSRFDRMLQGAMEQKTPAPSKAEMYFQLAAAFGAPTRTGAFTESMGKAGEVLAGHEKAGREATIADMARRQSLGLQAAQQRAAAAKSEAADLRQLTAEEMKDRRAMSVELIKDYVASGKPQSIAGKQALDEGLQPGTPQYQSRVSDIGDMLVKKQTAQIDALLASQGATGKRLELAESAAKEKAAQGKKLTPMELKLKAETEDSVAMSDKVLGTLRDAYKLNPNTFDTSVGDTLQRKALEAVGSKTPKVENTRLLENMLSDQAVAGLKASFGGSPTEGERAIILSLQGIGAKSVEERGKIIQRAYEAAKIARERHQKRLSEINKGAYRQTTDESTSPDLGD